jgi:hypothetical protein
MRLGLGLGFAALAVLTTSSMASTAAAGGIEIGAGVGLTQSSADAQGGASSQQVDTLFGRLGILGPFALQAELGHTEVASGNIRSVSADAVLQFGDHWRPFLLAGVGGDTSSASSQTVPHFEGGIGLEYRTSFGLTLGVDLRDGTHSVNQERALTPTGGVAGAKFVPAQIADGDYRTIRATVGISF